MKATNLRRTLGAVGKEQLIGAVTSVLSEAVAARERVNPSSASPLDGRRSTAGLPVKLLRALPRVSWV